MSTATELMQAFDALPLSERDSFVVQFLRRTKDLPIDSGPLTDEELTHAGGLLFAGLDEEEAADSGSK